MAWPQRDTGVARMDFCWAHAMQSPAGYCRAETDERNGVLKKDASSRAVAFTFHILLFSLSFFFFNLSPHLTQVMYDKKFSRFFFFLFLKRWLCSAPTLTISGWVQSARVNILPCCTHHLAALPVGWMCGFKGIVGEGLCLFFLFCVFVRVVSAEKIRFVLKPAIFSILSTSICFIPVCVCVDYVMFFFFFFCHFYSLFGGWLSEGYFSGKYVKREAEETHWREKKR